MSIASLRAEVEQAEANALEARGRLVVGSAALHRHARQHWYPRAVVGAGALVGYWFEGHLNGGSSRSDSTDVRRKEPVHGAQEKSESHPSSASGIAGWLSLAVSAFRLADVLKPLLDQQSTDEASNASRNDTAGADDEQVTAQTDLFTEAEPRPHAERQH